MKVSALKTQNQNRDRESRPYVVTARKHTPIGNGMKESDLKTQTENPDREPRTHARTARKQCGMIV